jgi:hypoxia up-regulated 1
MLNISETFLSSSKSVPADQQYFTEVEITTLDKLVRETIEWRNKLVSQQDSGPQNQAPVLTIRMIAEKIDALDREVSDLIFMNLLSEI